MKPSLLFWILAVLFLLVVITPEKIGDRFKRISNAIFAAFLFALIVNLACLGCACSTNPAQPNGWDRAGNSIKHGFTAVRVGTGLLVKEFSVIKLTLATTGTITAQAFVWDNNPPVPSPAPLTIQTGVTPP